MSQAPVHYKYAYQYFSYPWYLAVIVSKMEKRKLPSATKCTVQLEVETEAGCECFRVHVLLN